MGYTLEQIEPGIVVVNLFGNSTISDRINALQEVNAIRDASDEPIGALIDMSEAHVGHYSAAHALAFSEAVSRRRHPSKVAYVMRPSQGDMVATTMTGLHGPKMFRRFATRDDALAWLQEPLEVLPDSL